MGIGTRPPATRKCARVSPEAAPNRHVIELNEAFASQGIAGLAANFGLA